MIKAAFEMGKENADGRRAIAHIRGTARLKTIDANLGRSVKIPTGIGPKRFDVTVIAFSLATE